jgi:F-type H+-transporting ATPase subunit alpha
MTVEDQVAVVYSGTGGYLDRLKVERVLDFHENMLQRLHSENSDLMSTIAGGDWEDSTAEALGKAIEEAVDDFGPDFDQEGNEIEEGESDRVRGDEQRGSGDEDGDGDRDEDEDTDREEDEDREGATA